MNKDLRYGFGRNWRHYLKTAFDEDRAAQARQHLLGFLGVERLDGLSVLDIGCGSGIHSLAAWTSGAARVVGFDFDPDSVEASRHVHRLAGSPPNWEIHQGSVLDEAFMAGLGSFDLVYAWGVLHHTGAQWQALGNAIKCLGPRGRFYVALYCSDVITPSEEYWLDIKRRYNLASPLGRIAMEARYIWRHLCHGNLSEFLRLPLTAREYRRSRGMALMTDVRDWLGGWPMEFSAVREVVDFCDRAGLEPVKLTAKEANAEYLFVNKGTATSLGHVVVPPDELARFRVIVLRSLAELNPDRPIYIFGTARGAEILAAEAHRLGAPPIAGYIDIERRGTLSGQPILSVEELAAQCPPDTPVVISNRYVENNATLLIRHGFTNIANGHQLVVTLNAEQRG